MGTEELLPLLGQPAVRWDAGKHRRDILVAVAGEPGADRGDFEHELGVLLRVDEKFPDILRDAIKRQGAQLAVLGGDRPGIARASEANTELRAVMLPGMQCSALAVSARFVAAKHEDLGHGGRECLFRRARLVGWR